ncbi:MAG: TIM barrel protein [Candidatus Gygaella obscura]|nr:TIM barrel protein [Candidatus Gygaella obscura]
MSNIVSLSTAWNSKTTHDTRKMLEDIKHLGVDFIELGYNITPLRLKEINNLLPKVGLKVSSVHNYCPLPLEGMPKRSLTDRYRLSSLDETERKNAVNATKVTIETAASFNASVVVLHAGTVEFDQDSTKQLLQLYRKEAKDSSEYENMKSSFLTYRTNSCEVYLKSAMNSIEELIPFAVEHNVRLGIETRYYPNEIPDFQELEIIFKVFNNEQVVYWHDLGHAEVSERLGFTKHKKFLEKHKKRLYGMHIHDLKGIDDHLAPFTAEMDFSLIEPYINKHTLLVVEAHSQATKEELKHAVKKLKKF